MKNPVPSLETRKIIFHGHVQGVYFRKTTEAFAKGFPVGGYVRNLPDGSVELLVQGTPEEVESFLAKIFTHYQSNISDSENVRLPTLERFMNFEIR